LCRPPAEGENTVSAQIQPGQTWVSKDKRDGDKQVLVTEVNEHFVYICAFRRSRVRRENFLNLYRPLAAVSGHNPKGPAS
jgi:hypothetical protein